MKPSIFDLVSEPFAELVLIRSGKNHPLRSPTQQSINLTPEEKKAKRKYIAIASDIQKQEYRMRQWNEYNTRPPMGDVWVTNGQGYDEELLEFN